MDDPRFSDEQLERFVLRELATPQCIFVDAKSVYKAVRGLAGIYDSVARIRKRYVDAGPGPYRAYEAYQLAVLQSDTPQRVESILQKLVAEGRVIERDGRFLLTPEWRKPRSRIRRESTIIEKTLSSLKDRHVLPIGEEEISMQMRGWRGARMDPETLRGFLSRHLSTGSYAHSVSYLRQALRKLHYTGHSYFDQSTLVLITTKEKGKLPFVLVAPVGSRKRVDKTVRLANLLAELSGREVIIKKMGERDRVVAQTKHGLRSYEKGEGWHPAYRHDDDTFDAPVINVKELTEARGRRYAELRRKHNHLQRNHEVEFVAFDPKKHSSEARKLLNEWAADFVQRNPEERKRNLVAAHLPFLEELPPGKRGKEFIALLMRVDGKPAGFSLVERIGRGSFGLYANIALTKHWGAAQELIMQTAEEIKQVDGRFLNMGGSEFEQTHEFKRQFRPARYERSKHLVVRPQPLRVRRR